MLKLLPNFNFNTQAKTKCGEIFCHNSTDFTVYCTFCEMKSFSFDDFLWHIRNLHFANDFYKTDCSKTDANNHCKGFIQENDKIDEGEELQEEDTIYDKLIQSYDEDVDNDDVDDFGDDDFHDNDSYEEPIKIFNKSLRNKRSMKIKTNKWKKGDKSDDEEIDFDSDEEFKPLLNQSVQCHQCGETFKNLGLLKIHVNRIHDEKSSESSHKKERHKKEISCNECDQIFPSKKTLYSHIVEYHLGFKCSMCDKRFKQRQQLERHEFCHTAERIYSCDMEGCNKSFTHKYYLQRHIDSHNKERKFVCDFEKCGKAFHTLRCLKAHKNRHTKPKNLICDTCGYTCREYDRLRIHQRVHTGEKPYGCQECGKRFTSNAALLEHTVSHTGIRSHVCSNCNASFTRQKSLYQHRSKCSSTQST